MAEKHAEHIGFNYITKLLNIDEYNTNSNKELFNNKFQILDSILETN